MPRDKETGMVEPDITVNGVALTFSEAMAVRVAISSFRLFVHDERNAKDLGERLAAGYDVHLSNVERLMLRR